MRALELTGPAPIAERPLRVATRPEPEPAPDEIRVRVSACACCRTDLHVVEGDLELTRLPVVPGHQVVGVVDAVGDGCQRLRLGDRIGVAWLHRTCGVCTFCLRGEENLCRAAVFTGWTADGGYAEALTVPEAFAVELPFGLHDVELAPLLCAGVIGFRALRRAEVLPGDHVALIGFGASAHVAIQVLRHWGCEVAVVTRGDAHRALAEELGAAWTGGFDDDPPTVDRAVVFAPDGKLVPRALGIVRPGGTVATAGIHMSRLPKMDYSRLWDERSLRSVANATRADAADFLALAVQAGVRTTTETFPLESATEALAALARGAVTGAAVLTP